MYSNQGKEFIDIKWTERGETSFPVCRKDKTNYTYQS